MLSAEIKNCISCYQSAVNVENIQILFKIAEENEDKRLNFAIKGTKIMTDKLPFLIYPAFSDNQQNLINQLFLAAPICFNSINLILETILQTFKKSKTFMKTFWQTLEFCAKLDEHLSNDENVSVYSSFILESFPEIKLNALVFVKLFLKQKMEETKQQYLDDYFHIFITFIRYTSNVSVIIKSVQISQEIAQNIHYFQNIRKYQEEMEQVMIRKSMDQPEQQKNSDQISGSGQGSEMINSLPLKLKMIHKLKKPIQISQELKTYQKNDNEDESSDLIIHTLESWLQYSEEPIVGNNENIFLCLKSIKNISILLSFIFDPFEIKTQLEWEQNLYTEFSDLTELRAPVEERLKKYYKGRGIQTFFYLRAQRALIFFTKNNNFKIISTIHQDILKMIFQTIYNYFHNDRNLGLLNHVGVFIDFLLRDQNHQSLLLLINYNLLFNLISNIYNPMINDLVINILDPMINTFQFSDDVFQILFRYCEQGQLFSDLSELMIGKQINTKDQATYSWRNKASREITSLLNSKNDISFRKTSNSLIRNQSNLDSLIGHFQPGKKFFGESPNRNIKKRALTSKNLFQKKKELFYEEIEIETLNYEFILKFDIDGFIPLNIKKQNAAIIKNTNFQILNDMKFMKPLFGTRSRKKITNDDSASRSSQFQSNSEEQNSSTKRTQKNKSKYVRSHKWITQPLSDQRKIKKTKFSIVDKKCKKQLFQANSFQSIITHSDSLLMHRLIEQQSENGFYKLKLFFQGFSSSKLITIYPNYNILIKSNSFDFNIINKEFTEVNIMKSEETSLSCSTMFLYWTQNINAYLNNAKQFQENNIKGSIEAFLNVLLDEKVFTNILKVQYNQSQELIELFAQTQNFVKIQQLFQQCLRMWQNYQFHSLKQLASIYIQKNLNNSPDYRLNF